MRTNWPHWTKRWVERVTNRLSEMDDERPNCEAHVLLITSDAGPIAWVDFDTPGDARQRAHAAIDDMFGKIGK